MDLLDENRSLIHSGKLLRQPDTGFDFGWTELFVLLFDNYRGSLFPPSHGNGDNLSVSGHDKTKGKGWRHQISSVPKGLCWPALLDRCLIFVAANST